ncbi:pyridoxal-phosphate dependent enzyme [Micromonospora sp. NPDC000207]|uniref:pyridoxal-phosphate dependent enzyme n=1 Tax=Micromonospora sp. NPDC000207 TaxID=3154246 RepID=UPI00332EC87D
MLSRVAHLESAFTDTPTAVLVTEYRGREHHLRLKYESFNPSGSIKDRTAAGLLMVMDRQAPLTPGTVVVESTSGNLGLALARQLAEIDCRLIAVIDPKTPPATRDSLAAAGVEVCHVDSPDGFGGYQLTRLERVRALCAGNPGYRWPNQYASFANPWIHQLTTGPEIVAQGGPDLDAVYVAVSTGGTLAGISAHLRSVDQQIRVVAVDAEGSMVTGTAPGRRHLAGIGASRPSAFLTPYAYDGAVRVGDAESIAVCRILRDDTGVALGGSSGCVLRACLTELAGDQPPRSPLCLCPDGGDRYQATVYDDAWLTTVGIAEEVRLAETRLRNDGLRFQNG